MKSIQARLQSRISLRAAMIRELEAGIKKENTHYLMKLHLENLVEEQSLDKKIMSKVYWRM